MFRPFQHPLPRVAPLQMLQHAPVVLVCGPVIGGEEPFQIGRHALRRYRCGIVLSEQGCSSGEMPDAIGWKGKNHSIVIECKISRGDFLADSSKPWRREPGIALGCERYYAAPKAMLKADERPIPG